MRAGISTPVARQFVFHTDVAWMKRVPKLLGIVLWDRICFAMPAKDIPPTLFRHELEHVYQQIRDGRLRFYLKYIYYQIRYRGYENNPYEIEAYEKMHLPLQESEEQALWSLIENSTH